MEEIWKDIKDYEGLYQVSSYGRVKSLARPRKMPRNLFRYTEEKILKWQFNKKGYMRVILYKNGKNQIFFIHRLVAETYIPNPYGKSDVNHKNGIKTDNRVENLEWCTTKENIRHSWSIGLRKKRIGKENHLSIIVEQYDIQGNFIQEWNGISEAGRQLRINPTNISYCCKGKRKTAGGYKWEYAKEG